MLRESLFLNSILTNCDVWVGLTKSEVEELEDLDLVLLRKFLQTPFSVPVEAIYLELGCLNVETIIKSRRLTYLHYLVKQDESSMLFKFFLAQWQFPANKNEWTTQVKSDLEEFGFPVDLEKLRAISINSFKSQVKKKAKEVAFYIFLEKKDRHSKLENIFYSNLKLQNYLNELNKREGQTMFSYRTRMSNYGQNYSGNGRPNICPLCHSHIDSQKWSYQCSRIKENVTIENSYSDIFSEKIKRDTVNTVMRIEKFRKEYLEERMVQQ